MVSRIGVTARVVQADGYSELRDALAQDWPRFLRSALPEVAWLMIPNVGRYVQAYVEGWKLDGIIFSGGDDLGEVPVRDETETRLVDWAVERGFPAFGVCRGLQLLQRTFGGTLHECDPSVHVGGQHEVYAPEGDHPSWALAGIPEGRRRVNSFHAWGIPRNELVAELSPFAISDDGSVEGAYHVEKRVGAVMWHPERESLLADEDRIMIRSFFSGR